eukprot:Partr_v1_DN24661_c0_g1_i2_m59618 putative Functions as a nucleotide exchange factor (NEF) for Hsp70 chaperones which accelerates the release of ADP. Required for fully efficient Hsp70-mediated folding of proteins (By similarity)
MDNNSNQQQQLRQEEEYARALKEPEWESLSGRAIDLKKLLRWGLQHSTRAEDTTTSPDTQVTAREPIDPKWLDVIMGKSDTVRIKECMERLRDIQLPLADRELACDELELLVEDLDNAVTFVKLSLLDLLLPCFLYPERSLRIGALWVLGTMLQNNPAVKLAVLQHPVCVARLLQSMLEDAEEAVRVKALYCISGFLKLNNPRELVFRNKYLGHEKLMGRVVASLDQLGPVMARSVVEKAVYLYWALLNEPHSSIAEYLAGFDSTFVFLQAVISAYSNDHDIASKCVGIVCLLTRFEDARRQLRSNADLSNSLQRYVKTDSGRLADIVDSKQLAFLSQILSS